MITKASTEARLELRAVETDEELRLANDLMAKAHGQDYFESLHWLESYGSTYPGHKRDYTRVALVQGEIAAALRVNAETIRIGEARLRTGGIGWVTTAMRFRRQGLCTALMEDTLEYLMRHRCHVAMLFGIANFYHRFNFVTTLANYSIDVETAEAMSIPWVEHRVREAKPGDISALQKIHNGNDGESACSLVRTKAHLTNRWERGKEIRVLIDEHGKAAAYFLARNAGDHLSVDEVGVADSSTHADILALCGRTAAEETLSKVRFLLPPEHPFARYLLHFRSTHQMAIDREEGGMMSFVDLGEALEHMIPEWENLVAQSALQHAHVECTLIVDREPYRIRSHHGAIDVTPAYGGNKVSVASRDLMQLVTGYAYLDEILERERRILSADAHRLLKVIFPKRSPYVWLFDRF